MPRSHIVPKFYLRAWAENKRIAMRDAESGVEEIRNLKTAGVLRDFYLRERPDGEEIYDVEWSLGEAENAAALLLRELPERWPPSHEVKTRSRSSSDCSTYAAPRSVAGAGS